MLKKRYLLLVLIIFLTIKTIVSASSPPTITITASPTTVQINDVVTLTVSATDDNGLSTISAEIMGSYSDYSCNGVTSCTHKWYTSYPGASTVQPGAKACDIDSQCVTTFATVNVVDTCVVEFIRPSSA